MVGGESHYYLGRRYRLALAPTSGRSGVVLRGSVMVLQARPGSSADARARMLQHWYRDSLRQLATPLLKQWADALRVAVRRWGIKRMKTKWGSCNAAKGNVWLNLELVKKPRECLEYVIVHELTHLQTKRHDDRFRALMDRHLPRWRSARRLLNAAPLAHETW